MPRKRTKDRPLIFITPSTQPAGAEFDDPSLSLSFRYTNAIYRAGGIPLVLPPCLDEDQVATAVAAADGVLLSGGDDICAQMHRPDAPKDLTDRCSPPDPSRDAFELSVLKSVFTNRKPLLAICRGHQLINVALGGTLYLDLATERPSEVAHNACDRKDTTVHPVAIDPKSLLARITGRRSLAVNSTHHQGLDQLAPELRPVAIAPDGLVEATELSEGAEDLLPWFLSTQFHPERLSPRQAVHARIFTAFIEACSRSR